MEDANLKELLNKAHAEFSAGKLEKAKALAQEGISKAKEDPIEASGFASLLAAIELEIERKKLELERKKEEMERKRKEMERIMKEIAEMQRRKREEMEKKKAELERKKAEKEQLEAANKEKLQKEPETSLKNEAEKPKLKELLGKTETEPQLRQNPVIIEWQTPQAPELAKTKSEEPKVLPKPKTKANLGSQNTETPLLHLAAETIPLALPQPKRARRKLGKQKPQMPYPTQLLQNTAAFVPAPSLAVA